MNTITPSYQGSKKRRPIQQQIADIYNESVRLGVKNPPSLLHHCDDIGITVTEAVKRAEARNLDRDRDRLKALRESKTAEPTKRVTDRVTSTAKEPKSPKIKGPTRSEQVFEILKTTGGATLKTIAEVLNTTRDGAWGATRNLLVAGRAKAVKRAGQETIYEAL